MTFSFIGVLTFVTYGIIKGSSEDYTVTVFERVNHTTVLSCGLPDIQSQRERIWLVNDQPISSIPGYREINANGSLTIRFQPEDSNLIYVCEAFDPDSATDRDTYHYMFSPLVEAFLGQTVKNVTLDWGSVYTFPCIFAGTLPRKEKMIFNHREVNEKQHNVTENSVVECYVENEYGFQHDKAFIEVRPGSKAWTHKFGPPSGDYCQSYSLALNESSVCLHYLNEVADSDPQNQPYLVSRACLSSAGPVEQAMGQLFKAWDRLLANHHRPVDGNDSSVGAFRAWRCVDWAKRLTCIMAYPRCRSLHPRSDSGSASNQFFENYPICQSHCLAVTGLFCLARLDAPSNASALDPLTIVDSLSADIVETGWSQLLSVPEAQNALLPIADLAKQLHQQPNNSAMSSVVHSCSRPGAADSKEGGILFSRSSCTYLPLESVDYSRYATEQRQIGDSSGAVDSIGVQCLSGNGQNYRGSSTMPNCLPWAAFYAQVGATPPQAAVGPMWPGLLALTIHAFPHSLDAETSSSAVCRNPLGLASTPFCLAPTVPSNGSILDGAPDRWTIVMCENITLCSNLNDSSLYDLTRVALDRDTTNELREAKVQRIIACGLVATLVCLLVIGYVIWRFRRCGLVSSGSSLCLSVLDFPDGADQKAGTLMLHDKDKLLTGTGAISHDLDGVRQQRDLERRRQLLNRRRRLRQLHPSGQCIASCCYRFSDCILCRMQPDLLQVNRTMDTSTTVPPDVAFERQVFRGRKSSLWNILHSCRLGRPSDKKRMGLASVTVPGEPLSSSKCLKPITAAQCRAVPIDSADDEEFEANTLSMQLQKQVAYVANAGADGRLKQSVGRCLQKVCANCGTGLHVTSSMCLTCRKTFHQPNSKEPNGIGDCAPNILHETPHGKNTSREPADEYPDPGFALTQSSMQILDSASIKFDGEIMLEMLFNLASMTHLLHPKVKELCYPRNRLIEHQRLSKRAFGWIILAQAPHLHHVVRRSRMLSVTTSERLGLTDSCERDTSQLNDRLEPLPDKPSDGPLIIVKMLNDDANPETQANFLREAEVLVELSHKNIIQLLGVCVPLKPPSLLFEYMPYGDLTTLLRHYGKHNAHGPARPLHTMNDSVHFANGELISETQFKRTRSVEKVNEVDQQDMDSKTWTPPANLTQSHLLSMALDACDAMVYLSDKYYVHRDVATRSFLVGNRFIVKLSDFSLCRPIKPNIDFVAKPNECVPIKWLPLESIINGLFHIDTDVWAYGIFLWELFSFASEPYGDLPCDHVVSFLEAENRLSCPTDCPSSVYELMLRCWSSRRVDRPSFSEIRSFLLSQQSH